MKLTYTAPARDQLSIRLDATRDQDRDTVEISQPKIAFKPSII